MLPCLQGSDGKSVRGTVQMVVRVAPLIDSQLIAAQTVANQGMKVKLMCSVLEGDPPVRIKWFHDGAKTAITTNHQLGISLQEDEDYSLLTFRSVAIRDMGNWSVCTRTICLFLTHHLKPFYFHLIGPVVHGTMSNR